MSTKLDDIARRIAHEDEMVNRRINWMLAFQGFLFVAVAELAGKRASGTVEPLLTLLCCAGWLASALAVLAILGAKREMDALMALWHQEIACLGLGANGPLRPPVRPFGSDFNHGLGLMYSLGLPVVVCLAWCFVVRLG